MNKTCLVTGASAGIGAATARLAARRGYDVVVNYRSDRTGAEAVAADVEAAGRAALIVQANVADPDQIDAMFAAMDERFGRLDALVNNAGIVDQTASIADLTHDRLRRMFDVNVIGAILVAQAAVARMQDSGGSIVNISSAAARLGSANMYIDYAASKGAIDTFTRGLAGEVAGKGIRVNAIRPGLIATEIHGKGGDSGRADRLAPTVPMQRTGTADEVAEAICYLLSDAASYVTGAILDVSGGR